MKEKKEALRAEALEKRQRLAAVFTPAQGAAFLKHFGELLPSAPGKIVAGYAPMRGEMNVLPLFSALARDGWVTALPHITEEGAPLLFRRWYVGEATRPGRYGTAEPLPDAPLVTPDAVIVPLLAFDRAGHRLGYGGGYYDRTLAVLRAANPQLLAIGAAYAGQQVAELPREMHDTHMDAVVTEEGVMRWEAN